MGETKKSIIVVADTHFGLYTDSEACDPNAFSDFLKWIKELETGKKQKLKLGVWGSTDVETTLILVPPEKMVFLGDILELWTASNEEIFASTIYLMQLLSELDCEKVYVLVNHDRDLINIKGCYPLGASAITIVEEDEYWVSKGEQDYCFLHGHQFDKGFELPTWKIMMLFRKPALAFGNWTWCIVPLFVIDWALVLVGFGGVLNWMLLALLNYITIPFLAFKLARPLWNRIRSIRYDPYAAKKAVADRLDKIWSKFEETLDPENILTVVYGHTHTIGTWTEYGFWTETGSNTDGYERPLMNIMNIPSWITESSKQEKQSSKQETIKQEISHVFLYITEDYSPLFIGWNIKNKKPYLIPYDVIFEKREHGNLSKIKLQYDDILINHDNIAQKLAEIDWSKELIDRWVTGFKTKKCNKNIQVTNPFEPDKKHKNLRTPKKARIILED
ncbi:MAG: hypothetical protein CW691_01795 [Candidatus Bathyarchaeum sp.]|nr:MAG: hypothetical protein CW691_01795 [Candidatus Bathyarchaeum sp.]